MKREFKTSRFWSNVTALRVDKEITEPELSEMIGANKSYITTARNNSGIPSLPNSFLIADILGVSIEELCFGAVGLEIRKSQLEAELKKLMEDIEDCKKDIK